MTLKDAIKKVLKNGGGGMRPADVSAKMEEGGFTVEGSTPLAVRVRNEMSNMFRDGDLNRKGGLYGVREKEKEEASQD